MQRTLKLATALLLTTAITNPCYADAADTTLIKNIIVKVTAPNSFKPVPFTAITMIHRGEGASLNASTQQTPFEDEVQADYVNVMLQAASSDPAIKVELFQRKADGKRVFLSSAEGHDTVISSFAGETSAIGW